MRACFVASHNAIFINIVSEQELHEREKMGFTRAEISLKEKTLAFVMRHRVEERAQGEVAIGREDKVVEDPAG